MTTIETNLTEQPWRAHYPAGIGDMPPLVAPATVTELLARAVAQYPKRIALSAMGSDISYQMLERQTRALAHWLLSQGLKPGDHVAVVLPNVLAHPIACMGVARAGLTAVCVNPLYTAKEIAHVLNNSPVRAVIVFEPMARVLEQARIGSQVTHVLVVAPGDALGWKRSLINLMARKVRKLVPAYSRAGTHRWRDVVRAPKVGMDRLPEPASTDVAIMLYSGGTTGQPKGVPLTHGGLVYNVAQQKAWLDSSLQSVTAYTLMLAIPLYHILGFGSLLYCLNRGGKAVLVMNPRDQVQFVNEWRRHRVNSFPAVNTLFNGLLAHEPFSKLDFSELFFTLGAGMPVQERTAQRWYEVTGHHITEAYGLTETGLVACNPVGSLRPGSVGLPIPGIHLDLRDDEGRRVDHRATGEICVRGLATTPGYWAGAEQQSAFTPDGYFRTGDIGTFDADGYLRLVDRKKEMIISSGFKIFPSEVERVLMEHSAVTECAVASAADPKAGEVPIAYVVLGDASVDEAVLLKFCEERLVAYKRPRRIVFRKELPKSSVGKILRRELRVM